MRFVQWLERASVGIRSTRAPRSRSASAASSDRPGLRRARFDAGRGSFTNLSAAFYKRFGPSEIYVVYGDPNQLRTKPSFIVKYILYVGAQKGT